MLRSLYFVLKAIGRHSKDEKDGICQLEKLLSLNGRGLEDGKQNTVTKFTVVIQVGDVVA